MRQLEGKTAVVTGTSAGMGKAIAELFVKEGANVVLVARRRERLEALAASLAEAPGQTRIFVGDIALRQTNEAMIDFAVSEFGGLDILVNNAGIMDDYAPVGELTDEQYERLMTVNTYGPMCAMRKAVQVMKEAGSGGSIVNVASIGGVFHNTAGAAYVASKAALWAMTKNTAYMYVPDRIRCNAIAPGGISTEISKSMGTPNMTGFGRIKPFMGCMTGVGRPEDIAAAALYLASDAAAFVNGAVIGVDGGWAAI